MIKQFNFEAIQFSISHLFALSLKCQTVLFDPEIGPYQVLLFQARVGLGVITMKRYSTFPKAPALLEPHHQIVSCHIQNTCWWSLIPLQRCSRCILQPQLPEPDRIYLLFNNLTRGQWPACQLKMLIFNISLIYIRLGLYVHFYINLWVIECWNIISKCL